MAMEPAAARRSRPGSRICATRRCAPPSASASASCSPSSAPSPTSISCWCARRCRSGRWSSASSISCSCPRSSRRCWPARVVRSFRHAADLLGLARARRHRLAAAAAAHISRRCCSAWCWSASARSSRRRRRPALSSRAATTDRGAASGIYLACYFSGGLVGSAVLGQLFDRFGWPACVAGIALSLAAAALLTLRVKLPAQA